MIFRVSLRCLYRDVREPVHRGLTGQVGSTAERKNGAAAHSCGSPKNIQRKKHCPEGTEYDSGAGIKRKGLLRQCRLVPGRWRNRCLRCFSGPMPHDCGQCPACAVRQVPDALRKSVPENRCAERSLPAGFDGIRTGAAGSSGAFGGSAAEAVPSDAAYGCPDRSCDAERHEEQKKLPYCRQTVYGDEKCCNSSRTGHPVHCRIRAHSRQIQGQRTDEKPEKPHDGRVRKRCLFMHKKVLPFSRNTAGRQTPVKGRTGMRFPGKSFACSGAGRHGSSFTRGSGQLVPDDGVDFCRIGFVIDQNFIHLLYGGIGIDVQPEGAVVLVDFIADAV